MIDYFFYVCPLNCLKKLLLSFNLKTCQIIGPQRLKWVKTYVNGLEKKMLPFFVISRLLWLYS